MISFFSKVWGFFEYGYVGCVCCWTTICGLNSDNGGVFNFLNTLLIFVYVCNPPCSFEYYNIISQTTCIIICLGLHHGNIIGFMFIKMWCFCCNFMHNTHYFGLWHSYLCIVRLYLGSYIIPNNWHSCPCGAWSYLNDMESIIRVIDSCKGYDSIIG